MWTKTLIIVIPITVLISFDIYRNIGKGDFISALIPIAALILWLFFRKKLKSNFNNDIEKYFLNETPEQLLNYYDNIYKRNKIKIADSDVSLNYIKSVICCYYGEFDKCREIIEEIDWEKRSPYIQSLELSVGALLCYLQSQNYKEGRRLSIISEQLGNMSDKVPGSQKTKSLYEVYVQIGEALNGNLDDKIIDNLEQQFNKSPILVKLLIGWGLSKAYDQLNMQEKSKEKLEYCRKAAPYCKPLFD